jgi:hypothetical protein
MLGAAISHPDWREVMPWMPEPMVQPEGTDKNDGERHAAKRFVATWRQDHPHRKFLVTEDRLSSHAPPIATLQAHALRDILGVKAGDHTDLFKPVQAAEHAGRVSYAERHDHVAGRVHRCRLVNDVPLNESNADVWGNCIESWDMGADNVQPCSGVTDWRVSTRHVYRLMGGGRARWKIEHETFKTLQNQGDHVEHHDGHGQQHLSVVLAMLMLLAFLVDQTQQRCGALLQAVWTQLGSKRLLWERMRALCYAYALESMRHRLEALVYGVQTPEPSLALDSSSSRQRFPVRPCAIAPDDPPAWRESSAYSTRSVCWQHDIWSVLVVKVSSKNGHGWSKR